MSKTCLTSFVGRLSSAKIAALDRALVVALDINVGALTA